MPRLPPELERDIFELAALLNPECMPPLLLVAHRVKIWIEPLLYRVLRICFDGIPAKPTPGKAHRLGSIRKMLARRDPAFLLANIHHISFTESPSARPGDSGILDVLCVCQGPDSKMEDLCLPPTMYHACPSLVDRLAELPNIRRFSGSIIQLIVCAGQPDSFPSHPFFERLTHMNLADRSDPRTTVAERLFTHLPDLPNLTHLAFHDNRVGNHACVQVLRECRTLRVFAIVCSSKNGVQIARGRHKELELDVRFAVLFVADTRWDWEVGARGGLDMWTRAEDIVARKRLKH
ncbi:hypothetical protein MKEN_01424500 [Mycena kentingensis (nom. inval.)]|nr:hypothetical protein MKEN_01424500 [Mycena kentingensis (nom. inval.)]